MNSVVTAKGIQQRIFLLRGQKVMLSTDLAELYNVEARALVQAIKRNRERFPDDFMFQLNKTEFTNLKSQIVTSSWGGLRRAAPYAFTERTCGQADRVGAQSRRPRWTHSVALRSDPATDEPVSCARRAGSDSR